ncbi:hAT transposon superfamily [Artemisia annua]|uniref:HAT transposon superfamily n=1 Tax=Artemisia annua TaxID=35608 RepID=A0A2U1PWG5_ARTAN|nr:hAT transposon superfamily [Artemisia annua]
MESTLFKNMVQEVRSEVDQCMGTWGKSGCSVLVDECRSDNGKVFLNFSVYCPEGLKFLRSVDGTNILDSTEAQ